MAGLFNFPPYDQSGSTGFLDPALAYQAQASLLGQQGAPQPAPQPQGMSWGGGNSVWPTLIGLGAGIASGGAPGGGGWGGGIGKGLALSNEALQNEQNNQLKQMMLAIQMRKANEPTALQQNLIAAGMKPGTPEFSEALMGVLQKPQTAVTLGAEGAFQKGVGELAAKRLGDISEGNRASGGKIKTLDIMQGIASQPSVYQGPGGNEVAFLKRFGKDVLGLEVEGADSSTVFQSLTNQLALKARNPAGGEGMPGNLSNADRSFLVETVPGLSRGREGNLLLIDTMRRLETRKQQELAEEAKYITQNQSVSGLEEHMNQWASSQPNLFDDIKQKIPNPGVPSNAVQSPSVETPMFRSEAEAEAAGVKPGTRVIINGVPGVWQ